MKTGTTPPLLITGMHRSGTTLLARMLSELGVFLGWRREANEEARTFLEINKWLLLQAGCAWDVAPADDAYSEPRARKLCLRFMTHALNSVWMSFFLGRPWRGTGDGPPRFDRPWGWKDPRSTLTLDLWAELYPDARVIHVTRHGVDVANSLVRRRARRIERMEADYNRSMKRFWLKLRKRRFETGAGDLDSALALWDRYQALAHRNLPHFADHRVVRFEDLLAQPERELRRLCDFLGLESTDRQLKAGAALPRPGRRAAFQADEALASFASRRAQTLQRWGYEP